jgi:hypothetical protein
MEGSYTQTAPGPVNFAWYIATSALRTRSSPWVSLPSDTAMPIETEIRTVSTVSGDWLISKGSSSARTIRPASRSASAPLGREGAMITNSSPP